LPKPGFNLFCAGHTFLADGKLLVAGGHIADGQGEPKATIFDPTTKTWRRIDNMNGGRWYPTVVALPDGSVLVSSGSNEHGHVNVVQQIGKDGHWKSIVEHNDIPLYPRMHVAPDGRVFLSGSLQLTQLLNTSGTGAWEVVGDFNGPQRDYGCSVMYDVGKVLIVGGGNPPQNTAQIIDLNQTPRAWKPTNSMKFARRQHNATILPDGTVLVTGGTRGQGGPNGGFNDLRPGQPVHAAELWDPDTKRWALLAEEQVDRCYHSTAVLLPDARVLSAGGGEYRPDNHHENDKKDSHRDAQIFTPPYLFRGPRPDITSAPDSVTYGQTFDVGTSNPSQVGQVNWVRLSSVTHSFNVNQRFNRLNFTTGGPGLRVTAPPDPNVCPPGHYMLFVLNKNKVPSVARIIRIQ
jgi:galactose oxidase